MWNLFKKEQNDIMLVSAKLIDGHVLSILVLRNYEYIFEEKVEWQDVNFRFQEFNEGIEIEKETLLNSIIEALNASDGSTIFKDLYDPQKDEIKLNISFEISQIKLKWSNTCKLANTKKMNEFIHPLLSLTSLFMLHNKILISALKEKDKIIEQYKDIKFPSLKKNRKANDKNVDDIYHLFSSKEFQDILSRKCADVFSVPNCKLMTDIMNSYTPMNFFINQVEMNNEEEVAQKGNVDSATTAAVGDVKANDDPSKPSKSSSNSADKTIFTVLKRCPDDSESNSQEIELKRRRLLENKLAAEKKIKRKNLKF